MTGGQMERLPATAQTAEAPASMPFQTMPATLAPDDNLLIYYALSSLVFGPFFLFALVPLFFRYHTLRYEVDEEGITARWGILFRREISLNYARIQDIHLSSNVVERWLGLAKIQVQTASGNAAAEMTIQGLLEYQAIRDFLYSRMRGARDQGTTVPSTPGAALLQDETLTELAATLREVAEEVRALRKVMPRVGEATIDE